MNEAARIRSLAIRAVRDVVPLPLYERIEARLEEATIAPAMVTLASARHHTPGEIDGFSRGCAGAVQQIYVGLTITRDLIEANPWSAQPTQTVDADLEIIAADVLVARGMSRLAGTDAAATAVAVVREFGQHQAGVLEGDPATVAPGLESSVLELSVQSGAASVGAPVDPEASAAVAGLDVLDPISVLLEGTVLERHVDIVPRARLAKDGLRSGATDTD